MARPASPAPPRPSATLTLYFRPHRRLAHVDAPLRHDISAVAAAGRTLFAACDETASVERLVRAADGFRQDESIALADHFDLPAGAEGEMDIEGLAYDGGALWITGSHSLKRGKPEPASDGNDQALAELEDIERDANRYFLGRLPLLVGRDGLHRPAPPGSAGGEDGPACLKMSRKGRNALTKVLHRDPHLAPAVSMPCKENGFDIEGLAVRGDRAFLGLRGPVLSGWAVVVELKPKLSKPGRLKLRKLGNDGRRYRKHFLPLAGLGIRDLRFDGDDLLVLAGPTMDHAGTGALFRWRAPLHDGDHRVHPAQDVERVMDLPYARGVDQAEGVEVVDADGRRRLLLVHDSPAAWRLGDAGESLVADLFDRAG